MEGICICNSFIYKEKSVAVSECVFAPPVLCYYATVQNIEGIN
jgi:hypothetical protein